MKFPGDQENPFLLNRRHKKFSIKKLFSRLCVICAVGLLLSACATSSSTTGTDGDTVVDNLRVVHDEDRAVALQKAVTVSNDGKMIAFAYDNGIIKILDLTTGRTFKRIQINYTDLLEVRYNFDNSKLLIIENDSNVRILDIGTGKILGSFTLPEKIQKIAVSEASDIAAFGLDNGNVIVYELERNRRMHNFDAGKSKIGSLAFHTNGKEIAFSAFRTFGFNKKKPIYIYDVTTGKLIDKLDKKIYSALRYSKDGDRLYIAGVSKVGANIRYYDFGTGKFTKVYSKANWGSVTLFYSTEIRGDYILATTSDIGFEVIKMSTGEKVYTTKWGKLKLLPVNEETGPKRIYPLYDGRSYLINYSSNNINEIYNAETNKITAYIYSDANDDFAVVSRDGRMEGNQAAISNVAWSERNSNKRVPLEATFDRYYTPNLLQSLLSDDFQYVEAEEDNLEQAIELAPDVEIISPDSVFTAQQSQVQIEVSATSNGDPVNEIKILVNGKPVSEGQRGLKIAGNRRTAEVELIPGQSTIRAIAITEQGYRSRPDQAIVNYEGQTADANLYVLAIGIDEYLNSNYNLNYATTDAEALTDEVESKAGSIFSNIELNYIENEEATKKEIVQEIEAIQSEARPQDMFVFYYAGHGVMSEGTQSAPGDFYLALHNVTQLYGQNQMLKERGLSATELRDAFNSIEAQKQLIILDACQSGGAVETFAMRGAAEEKAMIQLARSTGMTLLASTGTEQFATEFEQLGHGVFTYAILEGMSGEADGGTEDNKITVKELEAYLNDMVPDLTQKYKGTMQFPRSWSQGMDFPVAIVD